MVRFGPQRTMGNWTYCKDHLEQRWYAAERINGKLARFIHRRALGELKTAMKG